MITKKTLACVLNHFAMLVVEKYDHSFRSEMVTYKEICRMIDKTSEEDLQELIKKFDEPGE